MPMRPRAGNATMVRHMKSWASSWLVGCLNEVTSQPCGWTPAKMFLIALSLPDASMPLQDDQYRPAVLRVKLLLKIAQAFRLASRNFSALSLSRPPFSLVLCDLRWNSPETVEAKRRDKLVAEGFFEDFLLMTFNGRPASGFQFVDDATKNALGKEYDEQHQQHAIDKVCPTPPPLFRTRCAVPPQQDGDDGTDGGAERNVETADDGGKHHLQ